MFEFTSIIHNNTYSSIDPSQSKLSQAGKTVIVAGGASGIGFETARAFATAGASRVVLLARSVDALTKAKEDLSKSHPNTTFLAIPTDITDAKAVKSAFAAVREKGDVDVVVLSAAAIQTLIPTTEVTREFVQHAVDVNIIGNLNVALEFLSTGAKGKTIVNLSTLASHVTFPGIATYGATKLAWGHFLDHLQFEHKDAGLSVFQVHPGTIVTEGAKKFGLKEEELPQSDNVKLPAHFIVWLASPEAQFLRGRYVWAAWDVHELVARKEEIEKDPTLLTTTLKLAHTDIVQTWQI